MQLVYLSPLSWKSFSQRPHNFVTWFHRKHGGSVLWVDPYPTRLPMWTDVRRIRAISVLADSQTPKGNTPEWLTVIRPRQLPIEPLPGASLISRWLWRDTLQTIHQFMQRENTVLGIGKPSELALLILKQEPTTASLYDAMDDFPAFYQGISKAAMARRERKIANRVSRISVSSTASAERFTRYRTKLTVVHNACAVEALPPIPAIRKQSDSKILGYLGTIGHWFDWSFICTLAKANPYMDAHVMPSFHLMILRR